jgi:streptomycin 3"-kinase
MSVNASILAELLAPDSGEWVPASGGESGAFLAYDSVHQRYAKVVASSLVPGLIAERDRTVWFNETGIPGAVLLDWRESDAGACLVTRAVPGVPADRLDAPALQRAWPSVVATLQAVHGLATDRCPFDRGLEQMMALARATVAEGRVIVGFLPEALQHTPPVQILEQIEAELPDRLAQERAQQVVCHGDLCLPNILVDPSTDQVNALIDLGRVGTADPYADIALLLATARCTWPDEETTRRADQDFAERYGSELDPERQDFYLRLDPLTW